MSNNSITVNVVAQGYLRTGRRVYDYLAKIVESKSEYDLESGFRIGGDNFLSVHTLTKSGPNIFELLLSRLPVIDEEFKGDFDFEAGAFDLDYDFDKRSINTISEKSKARAQAKDPTKYNKRDLEALFMPNVYQEIITEDTKAQTMASYAALVKRVESIKIFRADNLNFIPKKTPPVNINNKTYFELIEYLFCVILMIEAINSDESPNIDWNSEDYISSPFTIHELKLCLNFLGISCMGVADINNDSNIKIRIGANQVWVVLLLNVLGIIAYQLPISVVPMYIQAIYGETTIFSNAYSYCFSFLQLFGVLILHRASERIGRRPVYMLVFCVYIITNIIAALMVTGNVAKLSRIPIDNISAVGKMTCVVQVVIRTIQGFFGLVTPMAITLLTDLAAPSIKATVFNLSTGLEIVSAMVSFLFVAFGVNSIPYALETPDTKENSVIFCSYLAAGIHLICLLICVFVLKESNASINAYKAGVKLGIKIDRTTNDSVRIHSTKEVFKTFCMNKKLVFMFFSYVFIIGNTQGNTVATGAISQNYLNRHITTLLLNASVVNMLSCAVGIILIYIYLLPLVKKIGEKKTIVIVLSSTLITVFYTSVSPPLDVYIWGCLGGFLSLGAVLTEGCIMSLTAAETTPQNRGSISGMMQVANSLGRVIVPLIWSAWMDRNMRDALFGNTMLVGLGLVFVAFIGDVLETPEIIRMKKEQAIKDRIQAEVTLNNSKV